VGYTGIHSVLDLLACLLDALQEMSREVGNVARIIKTEYTHALLIGGGSFSKKEQAQEDQYFRQKEKEELAAYRKRLQEQEKDKDSKGNGKNQDKASDKK
jgi:hypothetical protein